MKNLIKISLGLVLFSFIVVSCNDDQLAQDSQGSAASTKATVILGASPDANGVSHITVSDTLVATNDYYLNQFVVVDSGVTLTIEPGVTIYGETGTLSTDPANGDAPGTLIIDQGAKIIAEGTASNPIVFTSEVCGPTSTDDYWGGLIIIGYGTTNLPSTVTPLVEGVPSALGLDYGGSNDADNSGSLKYVRVEYAGNVLNAEGNETNGITFYSVGSETTVEHVMVSYGDDDAFEFFGGAVNAKWLIAYRNGDDDFDTDQGYHGKIQFALSVKRTEVGADYPMNGFESNGDDGDAPSGSTTMTNATFANFTVVGPVAYNATSAVSSVFSAGANLRDGSQLDVFNSIFVGYPEYQFTIESAYDVTGGLSEFGDKVEVEGVTLVYASNYPGMAGTSISGFVTTANENVIDTVTTLSDFPTATGLPTSAWSSCAPSFIVGTELAVDSTPNTKLSGDSFFTTVDFRGAFGNASDSHNADWDITSAWVKWCPSCN